MKNFVKVLTTVFVIVSGLWAQSLIELIENYGLEAIDNGDNTIMVTGSKTGATTSLELDIPESFTVIWKASLAGASSYTGNLIYITGAGNFKVTEGGEITHNGRDGRTVFSESFGSVIVSGGRVAARGYRGYAIHNESAGTINVLDGIVTASGDRSYAIHNFSEGLVRIFGGEVNTNGDHSRTVWNRSVGEVIIEGGEVTASGDFSHAVWNFSTGSLSVSGGKVATSGDFSYAAWNASGGLVSVSGGELNVSGDNSTTIWNPSVGSLDISGGKIAATTATGIAINNFSTGTIEISGGVIFGLGDAIDGENGIIRSLLPFLGPSGNAVIIAWSSAAQTREYYYVGTSEDLILIPAAATAKWAFDECAADDSYLRNGIAYSYGTNSGFIEVPQVTLTAATSIRAAKKIDKSRKIKFSANPVSDPAKIFVSAGTITRVIIYDNLGNTVFDSPEPTWNLRNMAGRRVAEGMYLVIVEVKDKNGRTQKYSARLGVRK